MNPATQMLMTQTAIQQYQFAASSAAPCANPALAATLVVFTAALWVVGVVVLIMQADRS